MKWHGLLSVALLVSLLAACAAGIRPQPGESPPAHGTPVMGVAYRMSLYCAVDFAIGDTWWHFVDNTTWPPDRPHGPFDNVESPYEVPGVVTLASADRAIFRADVDRSKLALVRVDVPQEASCL